MNPFVIAFRRIIYSIPLKRLLLGLAVFSVLFASFSNAENVSDLTTFIDSFNGNISSYDFKTVVELNSSSDYGTYCIKVNDIGNTLYYGISFDPLSLNNEFYYAIYPDRIGQYFCLYSNINYIYLYNPQSSSNYVDYDLFELNALFNTQIPVFTSLQCQTEYNLIPISSVDQNYCTTNNLCPAGGTSDCPNVGVSNLYINDIFHPGAFNIIMNIPEEIDWDYDYTNSGQNFNLDVVGYNQDFEKIEGWIETNNYKPSSDDFTNIFTSGFSNFGGLLVATLFVILVFYFVKKMFK